MMYMIVHIYIYWPHILWSFASQRASCLLVAVSPWPGRSESALCLTPGIKQLQVMVQIDKLGPQWLNPIFFQQKPAAFYFKHLTQTELFCFVIKSQQNQSRRPSGCGYSKGNSCSALPRGETISWRRSFCTPKKWPRQTDGKKTKTMMNKNAKMTNIDFKKKANTIWLPSTVRHCLKHVKWNSNVNSCWHPLISKID